MMAMAVKPDVVRAPRKCRGKQKYVTALGAADGLLRLSERIAAGQYDRKTGKLCVYRCDWCSSFHIGHEAPK